MSEMIIEPIDSYGLNITAENKNKPLFSKIGVVGAGKEGRNIINMAATAGMEVIFLEETKERIDYVTNELEKVMDQKISSWGLTQVEKRIIMNRIFPTLEYEDFAGCDLVIECTRYSEGGRRSTPLRKLLEIVSGMYTSEEVYKKMELFAKLINYKPHKINESNGNVSMRIMVNMLNEACQILLERVCSFEDLEETFTIIYGQRYGVFRMADIIGIERLVTLMEAMFNEFGEKHYKPSPLLWKLYRSNQLGVRTGKGFYIYDESGNPVSVNKAVVN